MNRSENLTGDMEMTVLDRQRVRMKWQEKEDEGCFGNLFALPNHHQHHHQLLFQSSNSNNDNGDTLFDQVVNRVLKSDPDFENGWQDLKTGFGDGTGFTMMNYHGVDFGGETFKKRKANNKVVAEDETRDKKMKNCAEEGDSKITDQTSSKKNNNNNRDTSGDNTSKENSKVSEVDKRDYIHVRARRGQATDSHSLAERVRREKISERMKYLQDLVPGCNKITGKAGMLDEIINYVQSLQRQVEFLSMKLAVVNPRFDVSIDNLITKEVFPACTTSYPTIGVSSEMGMQTNMHFNQLQQLVSCGEMEMGINNPDLGLLRRTTSAPLSSPETFLDSSCFTQVLNNSGWDADLQNIYSLEYQHAGRSGLFPSQQFTGSVEASNLKMEM